MAGLLLLAAGVAVFTPCRVRISRVGQEFRNRPGLQERIETAIPADSPWQFDGLSYHSQGIEVRLIHGEESHSAHYLSSLVVRPRCRTGGRWFCLHICSRPQLAPDDFETVTAGIGNALEAHAGDLDPWDATESLSNLPGQFYGAMSALLLCLLAWTGWRTARQARHPLLFGGLLLGLLAAAFLFRRLFPSMLRCTRICMASRNWITCSFPPNPPIRATPGDATRGSWTCSFWRSPKRSRHSGG